MEQRMNRKASYKADRVEMESAMAALERALLEAGPDTGLTYEEMLEKGGIYVGEVLRRLGERLRLGYAERRDEKGEAFYRVVFYAEREQKPPAQKPLEGAVKGQLTHAQAEANVIKALESAGKGLGLEELENLGKEYTGDILERHVKNIRVSFPAENGYKALYSLGKKADAGRYH